MERYLHTQVGRFHWLVGGIGIFQITLGIWVAGPSFARLLLGGVGSLLVLLALSFARLTIRETGDRLRVRFGPLPLFGRSIPYGEIRSVRRARSWLVDGWGIHWLPGRGWTWNLQGRDCVELETSSGRLRLGTDDPEGLLAHLERRVHSG